jgi:hypothetical protein
MNTSSVGKAYSSALHDKLARNRMGVHLSVILFVLAVPSAIWQGVRRHEESDKTTALANPHRSLQRQRF